MSYLSATHWQPPGGVWPESRDDEFWQAHVAASRAAHERGKEYARLYTRYGTVAHLSPPWGSKDETLCPVRPRWPGDWLGTGSQAEYELAAELETCSRCRQVFMDSQKCGNPECPCQRWGARELAGEKR